MNAKSIDPIPEGCIVKGLSKVYTSAKTGSIRADDLESRIELIAELLAAAPPQRDHSALVFRAPDGNVLVREITAPFTVGRSPKCNWSFSERRDMSSRHFLILTHGDACVLEDCGSRNGTQVNGAPAQRVELLDGDLIKAAGLQFLFVRKLSSPFRG